MVEREKKKRKKRWAWKVKREQFRRRGYQMRHSRCRGRNDAARECLSIAGKKRLNWPAFPSLLQRQLRPRGTLQTRFPSRIVQPFSTTTSRTSSCAWTTCSLPYVFRSTCLSQTSTWPLILPASLLFRLLPFNSKYIRICATAFVDWNDGEKVCPSLLTFTIWN